MNQIRGSIRPSIIKVVSSQYLKAKKSVAIIHSELKRINKYQNQNKLSEVRVMVTIMMVLAQIYMELNCYQLLINHWGCFQMSMIESNLVNLLK